MAGECIWWPDHTRADGTTKESALFMDAFRETGDRDVAKSLWALSQLDEFRRATPELKYDGDGEPTFASMKAAGVVDALMGGRTQLAEAARKAGAVDGDGKPRTYVNQHEAVVRAVEYNRGGGDIVADIARTEDGTRITVSRRDPSNTLRARSLAYGEALYGRIRDTLSSLGFDVGVMEEGRFNGIFDPHNMRTTAENLKVVIEVLDGRRGWDALPEEFAHVMLAGLRRTELAQRLINLCRDADVMRMVLGEDYAEYDRLYGGDAEVMAEETAGKLMAAQMRGEAPDVGSGPRNLVQRIWDRIRGLFGGRVTTGDVDRMMSDAIDAAAQMTERVLDGSQLGMFDEVELLNSARMYDVARESRDLGNEARAWLDAIREKNNEAVLKCDDDWKIRRRVSQMINEKRYTAGCNLAVADALEELRWRNQDLENFRLMQAAGTEFSERTLLETANQIRDIQRIYERYAPLLEQMAHIRSFCESEGIIISEREMDQIASNARKVLELFGTMRQAADGMRHDLTYAFLKRYWKGDVTIDIGPNKGQRLTLEMVMTQATQDLSLADALWSSMGSCGDAFLSVIDNAFTSHLYDRDDVSMSLLRSTRALEQKRFRKGFKSSFMMERDSEGRLTGNYVSTIDYARYERAREAKKAEIRANSEYTDDSMRDEALAEWEDENNEYALVPGGKKDRLPKFALYGKRGLSGVWDFDGLARLEGWSDDQLEYYKEVISQKAKYDAMYHDGRATIFLSPQVMKDENEILFDSKGRPVQYVRERLKKLRNAFTYNSNDVEYGEWTGEWRKPADDGRPRGKRVPVHYVSRLRDMDLLSTDVGGSLIAYGAAAINYREMSRIADMFEIIRDEVESRKLDVTRGQSAIADAYHFVGDIFSKRTPDSARGSYIMRMLDHYLDKGLYGMSRAHEQIGNANAGKIGDEIRLYYSKLGLGLNPFASAGNWLAGKMQIFLESMSKEFYGVKDAAWAQKEFDKEILGSIADSGSANPQNKLKLMMEEFDGQFEFNAALRRNKFYNGRMQRIFGKGSVLMFMTSGLYDLHACNLLGLFSSRKVMLNGKKVRLWEAFETHTDGNGVTSVRLKDGVSDLDGTVLSENGRTTEAYDRLKRTMKERVHKVGIACNGAYNEQDLGLIHEYTLGRMVMQFRQWIPEHVKRRYGKARYDATLGEMREGFHRTNLRIAANFIKELRKGGFKYAVESYTLSEKEKANMARSWSEIGMFALLNVVAALIHHNKGDDDWSKGGPGKRAAAYVIDRELLEIGQFVPWYTMATNMLEMAKNPMASTSGVSAIISTLALWHLFERVETGTYQGWNRWLSDLARIIHGFNNTYGFYDRIFAEHGK